LQTYLKQAVTNQGPKLRYNRTLRILKAYGPFRAVWATVGPYWVTPDPYGPFVNPLIRCQSVPSVSIRALAINPVKRLKQVETNQGPKFR